jgi:hypothetical protein
VTAVLELPLPPGAEKAFRRTLAVVGEPWKTKKRGRRPERTPREYALALFVKAFYGWSLRTAEAALGIPRSCLHWASKRLTLAWVRSLVERVAAVLRKQYAVKCAIVDSTGVSLTSPGCKRAGLHRAYWKLHAVVEYAPRAHKIWFACARATLGNVADVTVGKQLLDAPPPSELYADKAYDAASFYHLAFKRGWRVCMQQRLDRARRTGVRGVVWRSYDDRKRRKYRGRIEAAFGGFANRYASRVRERLTSTRRRACLLWCVAHNVRTLAKSLASLLCLIYWTDSAIDEFNLVVL